MIRKVLFPFATAVFLVLRAVGPASSQDTPVDLGASDRQAGDAERDPWSKPVEVFTWLDVEPGDVVVDFHAGSGYNTWILSGWVGPEGIVFAEAPAARAEELKARLESGDLKDAGNVVYVESVQTLPSDSLKLFFISRNYHDLPAESIPEFLQEVWRTLEPGGILGIIDARTPEGRDMEAHRIADAVIVEEVTAAGFEHEASSELLANPEDDHAGPKWDQRETLDQSLLKFRKPAGEEEAENREEEEDAYRR